MTPPSIYGRAFWVATFERVLMTALQTFLAVAFVDGVDLLRVGWSGVLAAVGSAAALSLVKCLVANLATRTGPSLTNDEQVRPDTLLDRV